MADGTRVAGPRSGAEWQQWVATAALAVVLVVAGGCGAGAGSGADGHLEQAPPPVEALPARAGALPLEEELSGVVRALNQVVVRPEISATVVEVLVRNGDTVRPGQPLVRLDDVRLGEQLRQAEANLRLTEATAAEARARQAEIAAQVVRTRALAADALISDQVLETREAQLQAVAAQAAQAAARVEQAEATVGERRSALSKTVVRAPVGGRVGQRDVEVGMVVDAGQALFLLGDFSELVVEVALTQDLLGRVDVGTPVDVTAHSGPEPISVAAEISRISPFLERGSFSTTAEIDLPAGPVNLRPGMFVEVRVLHGESDQATLIPSSALWEDPRTRSTLVFVVEDPAGLAEDSAASRPVPDEVRSTRPRSVRTVAEGRGRVGVVGVEPGEWVVTVGQHLLQERIRSTGDETAPARVRPTSWDRVLELQGLQREDLLERFLARQRRVSAVLGAELPATPDEVEAALAAAADGAEGPAAAPVGAR